MRTSNHFLSMKGLFERTVRSACHAAAWVRVFLLATVTFQGALISSQPRGPEGFQEHSATDVLGPGDEVTVSVLGLEELTDKVVRVDTSGTIDLVMIGRVAAAGLTIEELRSKIQGRLTHYMASPDVAVNLRESRSKTVSVVGSLNEPGLHPLESGKTLIEVLSLAGGLSQDAGYKVHITRQTEYGPIPLDTAAVDSGSGLSTAEVNLPALMEAENPLQNILIYPGDVVSVPRAKLVYAIGEVVKPGGFALGEEESVSVLKALSMAGGTRPAAARKRAKILRTSPLTGERQEFEVNLKRIIAGTSPDIRMSQDDILFVPNSKLKGAGKTALDAAIRTTTGVIIWRSR